MAASMSASMSVPEHRRGKIIFAFIADAGAVTT
jgi:hypothetical protein